MYNSNKYIFFILSVLLCEFFPTVFDGGLSQESE